MRSCYNADLNRARLAGLPMVAAAVLQSPRGGRMRTLSIASVIEIVFLFHGTLTRQYLINECSYGAGQLQ